MEAIQADELYEHFVATLSRNYPDLLSASLHSVENQEKQSKIKATDNNIPKPTELLKTIGKKKKISTVYSNSKQSDLFNSNSCHVNKMNGGHNDNNNSEHCDGDQNSSKKFSFSFF